MRNIAAFALITVLFISCVFSCASTSGASNTSEASTSPPSIQEQAKSGYWITRPLGNTITVIGISNPMIKRETEVDSAKADAARKVALFHGVQGKIEYYNKTGTRGFFDAVNLSSIDLDYDKNIEQYIEQLKYDPERDVFINDDGTVFIRFQYSAAMEPVEYISTRDKSGRPSWVSGGMPQIEGYMCAIGLAQRQMRIKDTIAKSTDAAVARIIQDISTHVQTSEHTQTGSSSGDIYTKSEGKLDKFLVLEFWIDPAKGNVYTLALARKVD